jgi:hypothetical protein
MASIRMIGYGPFIKAKISTRRCLLCVPPALSPGLHLEATNTVQVLLPFRSWL